MSLGHAVLTALLDGEGSGYELSKRFDVSVANYWSATPQQLYRELERLERDGLVAGRVVEQLRRPNKRLFTLTVAGRDELLAFTARPARPTALRDDLLVKLAAVDVGDEAAVAAAVSARLGHARAKLALYDRMHATMLEGRDEDAFLRSAERVGPYLTLKAGRMYERMTIRWCTEVLAVLGRRAHAGASGRSGGRETAH